ncbi:unnamed protein product (macronuclear) [Paramecium tetraurelia]|uniref:Uncharacterized protein n=1 Tax=Paramecium tetraurelia TaxID=5888 RepID=A0BD39_PARTE|nr:uncharacterized protein GSPATT00004550001 [Paramecium tetraurelia]CAK56456.1 unnamed protein product [Paramecium tetraurelia]|eukprot:XP_001423854.1 hypothetical protein (macronuclear) [Paramecium tetraurelia strain d4-2]
MKTTLLQNILKTKANSNMIKIHQPNLNLIQFDSPPREFYTNEFFEKNKNKIHIYESLEENMKYHYLNPQSIFDPSISTDMYYPYSINMKINRDLHLILAEAYFGSTKPKTAIIGNQATARLVRYIQDLSYDPVACDSKRNFIDFTNYILNLNGLQSQQVVQMDKYEFLSGKQFDLIEIEDIFRKPFGLLVPALKAITDGGLLIYTIQQFIPNNKQIGKQTKQQLNLFHNDIFSNSETIIQGTLAKFEQVAHDLGKHIEPICTLATANQVGHLTLCVAVRNGKKQLNQYHAYCSTCGRFTNDCEQSNQCNFIGMGPLYIQNLDQNKEVLKKCLKIKKYTNWGFLERMIEQIYKIPADCYPFCITKYMKYNKSSFFYEALGNNEGYFLAKSPYHNIPTIYTNMPWNILMGKVHQFMIETTQIPSPYVASFPTQPLSLQNLEQAQRIVYDEEMRLQSLPKQLKAKGQDKH